MRTPGSIHHSPHRIDFLDGPSLRTGDRVEIAMLRDGEGRIQDAKVEYVMKRGEMRILALDPGLNLGWATWDGLRLEYGTQTFDLRRGESDGMR